MTDFLKKITSVQNITTSAIKTTVPSAYTLSPGVSPGDWDFSGPGGKMCKVIITCNDAQKLIEILKSHTEKSINEYNKSLQVLTNSIKDIVSKLDLGNVVSFLDGFKNFQNMYGKIKADRDAVLKKPITGLDIPVKVFVKGIAGKQQGSIKRINMQNKSVDIEYSYNRIDSQGNAKKVTEKLLDIEIKNLCIIGEKDGKTCEIKIGAPSSSLTASNSPSGLISTQGSKQTSGPSSLPGLLSGPPSSLTSQGSKQTSGPSSPPGLLSGPPSGLVSTQGSKQTSGPNSLPDLLSGPPSSLTSQGSKQTSGPSSPPGLLSGPPSGLISTQGSKQTGGSKYFKQMDDDNMNYKIICE